MATPPTFSAGAVLTAAQMNQLGCFLVKTQAVGSGVSSVTVNDCFTADYDNYKVIYSGGQNSTAVNLHLQLTLGGTASTTGYYGVLVWGNLTTAVVAGATDNNASQFSFAGGGAGPNNGAASVDVDLLNPAQTMRTRLHNAQVLYSTVYGTYTGLHDVGTAYDGIKLIAPAGTLTGGTIRVYGFRN